MSGLDSSCGEQARVLGTLRAEARRSECAAERARQRRDSDTTLGLRGTRRSWGERGGRWKLARGERILRGMGQEAVGGEWVSEVAPAKVNPFLEVLARREDGFHEVELTLLALELGDVVRARATRSGTIELGVDGPFASADIPLDARNLAWSGAAAALAVAHERGERAAGLELVVTKNVPSQAGLGGGSSDAAAALRASERALGLAVGDERASAALAKLGSDCVFFHAARSTGHALARGRGERIELLEPASSELAVLVLTPDVGAPTAAVYRALRQPLREGAPPRTLPPELRTLASRAAPQQPLDARAASQRASDPRAIPPQRASDPRAIPPQRASDPRAILPESASLVPFNRLESAALDAVPALRPWRAILDRVAPGAFVLSGSGSSFFALFPSHPAAAATLEALRRALPAASLHPRGLWLTRPAPVRPSPARP